MKTKQKGIITLIVVLILQITFAQKIKPIKDSCPTCVNTDMAISNSGNGSFTSTVADAYYWEICYGTATIIGSNTSQNVSLHCSSNIGTFKLKLVRFIDGNCYESCEVYNCGDCDDDDDDECPENAYIYLVNENNICETLELQLHGYGNANIDYVNWTYSVGPYESSHQSNWSSFGWDITELSFLTNHIVHVCAEIVLDDGTICDTLCDDFLLQCENNDGINRTSVNPNPSNGKIKITKRNKNVEINKIEIYNNTGGLIFNNYIKNEKSLIFDLSNQKNGVYFVKILFSDGTLEQKSIIIK